MRSTLSALLISAALLQGCSVKMAIDGRQEPNLGAINTGTPRQEVEVYLGAPFNSATDAAGNSRIDAYQYQIGHDPNAWRAAGHLLMDVFTLGIWEFVGTPMEQARGGTYHAYVRYDANDRVLGINTHKVEESIW